MVNAAPQYSPESQMWSVFDSAAKIVFNPIDYNTLMGARSECKPLIVDGTLSIIKEAHEEAAKCRSTDNPDNCYDDVAFRIGRRYRAQRTQVIICARRARLSISDDGIAAIQDSLTKSTISVVLSVFKKKTGASDEDVDSDVAVINSDEHPENAQQDVVAVYISILIEDNKSEKNILIEDSESEDSKSKDSQSQETKSRNNETKATEPENPESEENESGDAEPEE